MDAVRSRPSDVGSSTLRQNAALVDRLRRVAMRSDRPPPPGGSIPPAAPLRPSARDLTRHEGGQRESAVGAEHAPCPPSMREPGTAHTPSLAQPFPLVRALQPAPAIRIEIAEAGDSADGLLDAELQTAPETPRAVAKAEEPITNVVGPLQPARARALLEMPDGRPVSVRSGMAVFVALAVIGAAVGAGIQYGGSALMSHPASESAAARIP